MTDSAYANELALAARAHRAEAESLSQLVGRQIADLLNSIGADEYFSAEMDENGTRLEGENFTLQCDFEGDHAEVWRVVPGRKGATPNE